MKWLSVLCILLFSFTIISKSVTAKNYDKEAYKAPEFTHTQENEWINSKPISMVDLKGKVILIDMWTFDCWNCYRSFPWLNSLEKKYQKKGFQIIGVHSPEFDHEKVRQNVIEKAKKFKLHHPIMMDNDFSYWRSLNNRFWPTFYLIDKDGNIVYSHIGETHHGDIKAIALETRLIQLLP